MAVDAQLRRVKDEWEALGSADPLWAIVSRPDRRGGRWDPSEFFATGIDRVDEVWQQVRASGLSVGTGRALDFGCGVGRLSTALANRFDEVVGVDVSRPMIEAARRYNRRPDRVAYRLNATPDLRQFDSGTFTFVLADIVLQHVPRRLALRYVREFLRVLSPEGVAAFQIPSGPISPWLQLFPAALLDPTFNLLRAIRRRLSHGR